MSLLRRIRGFLKGTEDPRRFAQGTSERGIVARDAPPRTLVKKEPDSSRALQRSFEPPREFREALEVIQTGAAVVFVSGRAGTGKTTFVRWLREVLRANLVVVAPTGIAALNSGGQTIHSFFRFPPRPLTLKDIREVDDRKLYEATDVLVIDEASMLRADLLDGIDAFLRLNGKHSERPFGGIQVVLVGDLFQLPPVVSRREEAFYLAAEYTAPYFFAAKVLQDIETRGVEFSTAYRHPDPDFDALLTRIREGRDSEASVQFLNSACLGRELDGPAVTLACTNKKATTINDARLSELPGREATYEGTIRGRISVSENRLPAPAHLVVKPGAQVLFTKNDSARRWVNGTIGIVEAAHQYSVRVNVPVNGGIATHEVGPAVWETVRHKYNAREHCIETEVIGSYTQLPLTLAWAITIHKSQGQTLDRVAIDFGDGAFAPGQAYVALSRCRTLEGLSLVRPLRETDVQVDPLISAFYTMIRERGFCGESDVPQRPDWGIETAG